jgi:glycosyltransferase involved in cell wall biosynthesis
MRLVITTPFLEVKGGMERVVLKIAQRFDARIRCISYDPENTFEEFKKLAVETAKPTLLSRIPVGNRVSSAIDAGNHFYNLKLEPKEYDLINAHQTPSEWVRNRNSPVLWYCHTPNREAFDLYEWRMKRRNPVSKAVFWASIQAYKHFEFQTVPKIEYVFTNSRNSQDRIRKYLKRESEVLHPGVEVEKFSCKAYEEFFFYPARMTPEKEIEYAIEAFKLFKKRANAGGKPETGNWKLVIAGGLSKRPEHLDYYKKMKALCDASITIETNVSEERLLDLYARCYAVLYTPQNEDFGLIPFEAFASSKPCIARNEGGPKETIHDLSDGFLVNSVFEMSERMEFLAKNPDKTEIMGKQGRKKVETHFTWDVFLKRFEEKAKEIVEARNAGGAGAPVILSK